MSMRPDRLSDLRRQRALLQEHLAWLDREITLATAETNAPADATSSPVAPGAPLPVSVPPAGGVSPALPAIAPAPTSSTVVSVPATVDPEAILEQYRKPGGALHRKVRQGCFLYFAAAFVLLGLGVVALYFLLRSR